MTPTIKNPHHALPTARLRAIMAFTLIELLVVIAIIAILMSLAFPAIAVMQRLTRGGATQTTIGVAVRTASAYAAKPVADLTNPYTGGTPPTLRANGAAVLFTPNGDIRILETDRLAFNAASPSEPLQAMSPARFGYTDVQPKRDYINLPGNAGVVGIIRVGPNTIRLITPPFAVRFDRFGQINTGSGAGEKTHMVYYDSNYDGQYDDSIARSSTYNPDIWDSRQNNWNGLLDPDGLRPQLPFEEIETVVGVLMFVRSDFLSNGHSFTATSGALDTAATEWLLETNPDNGRLKNSQALFFSRNSGSILREYR